VAAIKLQNAAAQTRDEAMSGGSLLKRVWGQAIADGVPRRSLVVAIVVGTVLNMINQGDALFGPAPIAWSKLVLTYIVPYVVCTYGAVSVRVRPGRAAQRSGDPGAAKPAGMSG
jgi:hypothetical protein